MRAIEMPIQDGGRGGGEGESREGADGISGGSKHDHALLGPPSGDDIRGDKNAATRLRDREQRSSWP